MRAFDWRKGMHIEFSPGGPLHVSLPVVTGVLRNSAWGIGDACCYAWILHSVWASGGELRFEPRRNLDVFTTLGVPQERLEGTTKQPAHAPAKGEFGGKGWVRHWLTEFGFPDVPLRRPPWTPSGRRYRHKWGGGTAPRVVICPQVVYKVREWPSSSFAQVAHSLMDKGWEVATSFRHWSEAGGDHVNPVAGLTVPQLFDLIAGADLVIGNDSGPVHIAGTLGIPAIAVCGPSPGELFFEHLPEVIPLGKRSSRGCVGCNWFPSRGYVPDCASGCTALIELEPEEVVHRAESMWGAPEHRGVSVDTELINRLRDLRPGAVAVETGTYDGMGSTAGLLSFCREVHSIEINPARWRTAWWHNRGPRWMGQLFLHLGKSVSFTSSHIEEVTRRAAAFGVKFDGSDLEGTIRSYQRETEGVRDENVLPRLVKEKQPDIVLLDSAGGMGYLEWRAVEGLIKPGAYLALDDTRHVKHVLTMKELAVDPRFEKTWEGTNRNGSAIWRRRDG